MKKFTRQWGKLRLELPGESLVSLTAGLTSLLHRHLSG